MFHILVVEDDAKLRSLFCTVLNRSGYLTVPASGGREALELLDSEYIDLIISDIMMPGMDGYELIRTLRGNGYSLPILIITAKERFEDKQEGFQAGTDDYMVKPIDVNEMVLRVGALLKRARIATDRRIICGKTTLDYDALTVTVDGEETLLPQKEFYLLYKLMSYPNKIFTRQQLMDEIWGMDSTSDERTVDVHINRLRERFRDCDDFLIMTVRGLGYKVVKKKNFHLPKYWFYMLILSFVILSVMPLMAGFLVNLIANGEEGKIRFLQFNPLFPSLVFFLSSIFISFIISLVLWFKVLVPLGNLSQAARQVSKGDFSIKVETGKSLRELRELTDNFNRMVQELGSIESFRNDFVTNISHEFKTPLAAIEGYVTLLQEPSLTEEDRNEYIRIIMDSTKQLSSMAGNILMLSRLEKQEIVTGKTLFKLDEQIRQSLLMLEPLWENKYLDLDINLPPVRYFGNPALLMQVWLNLFQNAIKFTPAGGSISASMKLFPDFVEVVISDTGIGMDEETMRRIFEKFYSAGRELGRSGNGLGLSITKRILELSGGTITVESSPDEGSLFTVTLPLREPDVRSVME